MSEQVVRVEIAKAPEVFESLTIPVCQPIKSEAYENRRWPYLLALPLMWLLTIYVMAKKGVYRILGKSSPRINTLWFDGLGPWTRRVKEGATSWRALDIIYNHPFPKRFSMSGLVDDFWWHIRNCQAIRNRFKLVRQEVRRAILRFVDHKEVRLISLACGSAQAVIEIVAEFKEKGLMVRAILVDIDQEALEYAKRIAQRCGVADQIETRRTSVAQVAKIARDFRPQIVEMLGLLDYIPQDNAIRLARKIREALAPGGLFLTCNIAPNAEQWFVRWVIDWPMIYRRPEDLAEITTQAGFVDTRLIYEPLEIHCVVVAQVAQRGD